MPIPRLRPEVYLRVDYADETPFGGPTTPKLKQNLKHLFRSVRELAEARGAVPVIENAVEILDGIRAQPEFQRILDPRDRTRIAPEILYPDASKIRPVAITAVWPEGGAEVRIDFHPDALPILHDLVSGLSGDPRAPEQVDPEVFKVYQNIMTLFGERGMMLPPDAPELAHEAENESRWSRWDATFLGHNTVVVRSESARVIVDPWMPPDAARHPEDYKAVHRAELGRIDAILLTHSHPDHFDPGTLLQFDRSTTVIVPHVEKECLLSRHMADRFRELGFTDVRVGRWWEEFRFGDTTVVVLPFHGEQPTTGEQLCPEVRNFGNTYLVRTPRFSAAFVADSGRDRDGDVRDVALRAYRTYGPIDALFTGYRGWNVYPIMYAESSVPEYLLFVPPDLYPARQSIMNSVSDAVDSAEIWHARYLAPYADGGAPWFWEIGLGPDLCLDEDKQPVEWAHFDPFPERALDALKVRSAPTPDIVVGSPVRGLLLRPGQSVEKRGEELVVHEAVRHRWPWPSSFAAVH